MSRGLRVLVVASYLIVLAALAAVVIWQAEAHWAALRYVLGVALVVLGVLFTTLHLTLGDEFLRRHFGEPAVGEVRRVWRRGWVGVLLGAAWLGMLRLDHWLQAEQAEVQF